jgi:uncharacterized protein with PIN domain
MIVELVKGDKMTKCMYCKKELAEGSVVDVCHDCGEKVWGDKMFQAILDNMNQAKEVGDLYQGSVGDDVGEINRS